MPNTDTHRLVFNNLVDSQTGKGVCLRMPNGYPYEGAMLLAGVLARQAARETLDILRETL